VDYQELIDSLTPDIVARFKKAVELGRWPDGKALSDQQREHCMRAIIIWDRDNLSAEERTGYIDRGHKQGERGEDSEIRPLRWDDNDGEKT
jgi:uncharacterized protein YeaC (DUF1315 family)